ncbi:MAG: HPF/RaiA family ribosome-associated protein [Acidobacteria bacterium]|nr:HPF/RaiA family ribosome-associated protein [Acidobacteriota bacterium]
MRLELTGRQVDITPALRRLIDGKLAKLARRLNAHALSAQAVLARERGRCRVDITLHARGEKFLHGFGFAGGWEPAVSGAVGKIAQQAGKVKGKWDVRKRGTLRTAGADEAPEASAVQAPPVRGNGRMPAARARMPRIVRTARLPVKPMTLADAARELDGAGAGVVVFRDRETRAISVLYRHAGELTLVETEA